MADAKTKLAYPDGVEVEKNRNPAKRSTPPAVELIPQKFHTIAQDVIDTMQKAMAARAKAQEQVTANKSILWNFVDAG